MRLLYLIVPLAACLLGCSRELPRGPVSGRVTIDGRPVTAGRITFAAKDMSNSASGELTPEGTYSITDAPTGEVIVAVRTKDHAMLTLPGGKATRRPDGGSADFTPNQKQNPLYVQIPPRYEDLGSSGLTVVITKSGQPFVYDVSLTR